jgi:hypothetical protein
MTAFEFATICIQIAGLLISARSLTKVNGVHTMLNGQKAENEKTIADLREAKTILEQSAVAVQRANGAAEHA